MAERLVRATGARAGRAHVGAGIALAVGLLTVAPIAARGQEAAPAAPAWIQDVTLNGFLSSSYSYNFNRPASRTNTLRVFDFDDNTFKLDVFELVAQKPVAKSSEAGFRVDIAMGGSVPRVSSAAGLFRDDAGNASDIDLQQAFASFIAPLGTGLRIDMGKFVTPVGYEVIEGYDGWNDHASRSFLFGYAIPFTHTGVRAGYTFSPHVSATALVVNGWDVARDNNRSKTVGAQLTLSTGPELTLVMTGMIGPEQANDDGNMRRLFDVVAIAKPTPRITVGGNFDLGDEDVNGPSDATWTGVAGYGRVSIFGSTAISVRAEYLDDKTGVRTGTAQTLREITLTPEQRLTPHLLLRADVRVDDSDNAVFGERDRFSRRQTTVLLNLIYGF